MMGRYGIVVALGALVLAGPVFGDVPDTGVEAALVTCIVEKDPVLAAAIKDAPSQEAFMEALKKGIELCPVDASQLSMGRFFDALNAALPAKTDEVEAVE